MAIIKAVNSRASIGHAIKYITKKEKTNARLVGGYNCNPMCALDEMKATKKAWGKTDGRQYKHFIQSFPKDEVVTLDEANQIARELIESWKKFQGYEVCYATHMDKEHIHTHIIVNSVSYEHGKKFSYSKQELQDMKDLSDKILLSHGKSICQKNAEITSFKQGAYKAIEKAEKGTYKSWVADIMLRVDSVMRNVSDKEMFISELKQKGIQVIWKDTRKNIVFVDESGNRIRDKKLTDTFKINISKESLIDEFERFKEQHPGTRNYGKAEAERAVGGQNQCGLNNTGEHGTERAASDIRRRLQEVSDVDKRYNVSARAKEPGVDKQAGKQLAEEGRQPVNEQSANRTNDRNRGAKVHRKNGLSR